MRKLGWFTRITKAASRFTGRPLCFALAVGVVLAWAITGPIFHYRTCRFWFENQCQGLLGAPGALPGLGVNALRPPPPASPALTSPAFAQTRATAPRGWRSPVHGRWT